MRMIKCLLLVLSLLGASGAMAVQVLQDTTAAGLPPCISALTGNAFYVTDAASVSVCTGTGSSKNVCVCDGTNWVVVGGAGGSGDITDVWGCASGNCNAITGASGDSLDAGSADASSPATRSTSLPGTCSEGQLHQDTNSGGSETYVCTSTDTWTKLDATLATEAYKLEYDPDRPPSDVGTGGCNETWDGDTAVCTWVWGNQGGASETIAQDQAILVAPNGAGVNLRMRCIATPASGDYTIHAKAQCINSININHCGIALLQGTIGTPTRIDASEFLSSATATELYQSNRYSNFTTYGSNNYNASGTWADGLFYGASFYLKMSFTDSSNNMDHRWSFNGRVYGDPNAGGTNIGGNPSYACFFADAQNAGTGTTMVVEWFRLRTDASKDLPGE